VYLGAWKFLNGKSSGLGSCPYFEDAAAAAAAVMELLRIDPAQTWAARFAEFAVPGQEANLASLRERLESWDPEGARTAA
jgi:hypothetical protein